MKCLNCGSMLKTTRENHNYKESGLGSVTLVGVEVSACAGCGDREVAIPAIEELHQLIAGAIVLKAARLVPEEIRFLRKHLGLSQPDLASLLGVTVESVNRWENAKVQMSVSAERLLRFLVATRQPMTHYDRELGKVAISKAARSHLRFRKDRDSWRSVKAA